MNLPIYMADAMPATPIILGSRSPRRLELLSHLIPREQIQVCSPKSIDEAGFDDLSAREEFDERILDIARGKLDDILRQIETDDSAIVEKAESVLVLTGDTTVIATDPDGKPVALGQPPDDSLDETVRLWFRDYFAGKTHEVVSGVCLAEVPLENRSPQRENLRVLTRVCSTKVTMRQDADQLLDWYLTTGESRGKAGGYAIQGAASVFVTRIEGSLSNVVGLPLEDTLAMLNELEKKTDGQSTVS